MKSKTNPGPKTHTHTQSEQMLHDNSCRSRRQKVQIGAKRTEGSKKDVSKNKESLRLHDRWGAKTWGHDVVTYYSKREKETQLLTQEKIINDFRKQNQQ